MRKALAPSVLFANELQGAETYSLLALVALDLRCKGIERLISKARRPPKTRILDLGLAVSGNFKRATVGRFDRYGNGSGKIGFYGGGYEDLAAFVALSDMELGYSCRVLFNKVDGTPDSHIGKIGSPVPTEHTV